MRKQVFLDTDIITLLRRGHGNVIQHVADYLTHFDRLSFTELTWYEIVRGYRVVRAHRQLEMFGSFCQNCNIFPLDHKSLDCAATIYSNLHRRGQLIGDVDILIAGTALANGMGMATRNVEHFSRISELHVENWAV